VWIPAGQNVAVTRDARAQPASLFTQNYNAIVNIALVSRLACKAATTMKTFWPAAVEPVTLPHTDAHLYAVPIGQTSSRWMELSAVLSADERQRAEQFRVDPPRRRFVTARAALRTLLGRYLNLSPAAVSFSVDCSGKPRLGAEHCKSDLAFNVSHSANLALIVLTRCCDVGVDVEELRPVRHAQHIARRYFHPAEIETILSKPPADQDAAFLSCWTGKEAVLKAVGMGITGSLAAFSVPDHLDQDAYVEVPTYPHGDNTRCWLQRFVPNSDYLVAVACVKSQRTVRCFAFDM
jgi:4'-phosphopantetheinyl transferase